MSLTSNNESEVTMKFDEVLRTKLDEVMTDKSDPKLAAILHGSLYMYQTLIKILNTKMTSVCPTLASEAYTTVNELAEKVSPDESSETEAATAEISGAV